MKIGLQAIGSTGDITPFLSLGAGLVEAGHEVTLAVTSSENRDYREMAARLGIELRQAGAIWETEVELNHLLDRMRGEWNPLRQMECLLTDMLCQARIPLLEKARALCADNDLVVGHFLLHPLHLAAQESGRPWLTLVHNHGLIPTAYAGVLGGPNLGRWLNTIGWKISHALLNYYLLRMMNPLYRQAGMPLLQSFCEAWESQRANLISVSPTFCGQRPDIGANQHVCGFFHVPRALAYSGIGPEIETFLAAGPKPVFVTMGSMTAVMHSQERLRRVIRFLVDTVRMAGCRAIIQAPWDQLADIPEHLEILRIGPVDYHALFPRCSVVVHHGGAGTTHIAARCGVPSVVIWMLLDQLFWGRELQRLGLALGPLNWHSINKEKLVRRLRKTIESERLAENAKSTGARMAQEPDGVISAVRLIESALDR